MVGKAITSRMVGLSVISMASLSMPTPRPPIGGMPNASGGELVQCVVTDESAGRHVQHTVLGIKFLNCAPSASRITFTEYFRKIAVEQRLDTTHIHAHRWRDAILAGVLVHRSTPCLWGDDMVAGSTSETEIIESHRFSFLVCGAMACCAPYGTKFETPRASARPMQSQPSAVLCNPSQDTRALGDTPASIDLRISANRENNPTLSSRAGSEMMASMLE